MKAKDKAIDLYNKFRNANGVMSANGYAKKQAIISVNEILEQLDIIYIGIDEMDLGNSPKGFIDIQIDFYKEVKKELENY